MSFIRKLSFKIVRKRLRKKGFHPYAADLMTTDYLEDFFDNPYHIALKQRRWAWKRGFLAERIRMYRLDDENCRDYLSDYDYYRLFPFNNDFSVWIDDKLTLRYVLEKYREYLPKYYFVVHGNGRINYLQDWDDGIEKAGLRSVAGLLKKVGVFAAKPIKGAAGSGFVRMDYRDSGFFINGQPCSEEELITRVGRMSGYLFCEYVQQCELFEKVCPETAHTLRLQTVRNVDGTFDTLFAFIRWGSASQRYCVTHSTAGLTASVDADTGEVKKAFYVDGDHNYHDTDTHPDTGVKITGVVPNWDLIKKKCLEIHAFLGELEYIGFDVIITDHAFKLCEINSCSSIRASQRENPFMKNEKCKAYFERKMNQKNGV